jgi:uncharacterized protein YxjI
MELTKQREFLLKEKLLSFRDKVKVMTPDKEELGYFKGKIIKIGNTYRLYNINDENETNPLLTVHEKVISMRSTYTFYEGGEQVDDKLIGKLKRKIVSIKPSYWFEDANETRLFTMKGNIWQLKYKILYKGDQVAEISKKLFRIKGTYGIKMRPNITDDMAILVLGIVVMLHHEKEENR